MLAIHTVITTIRGAGTRGAAAATMQQVITIRGAGTRGEITVGTHGAAVMDTATTMGIITAMQTAIGTATIMATMAVITAIIIITVQIRAHTPQITRPIMVHVGEVRATAQM